MKNKRYSIFIKPLMLFIDLCIINAVVSITFDGEYLNFSFLLYSNLFWVVSSFFTGFYKIYRSTSFFKLLTLLVTQFSVFFMGFFTYFSLFREGTVVNNQTFILSTIFIVITISKYGFIHALHRYRASGNNYRNVIVIGFDETAKKIIQLFEERKSLGYLILGFFSDSKEQNTLYKGQPSDCYSFVLEHDIDEIYCSMSEFETEYVKELRTYANNNNIELKILPDADQLYSKSYKTQYYDDSLVVLSVNKLPFEFRENRVLKRIFDIAFSCSTIIFVMSWLTPITWILVRLESKGPVFFKQKREGLNGELFVCYKFRSMRSNTDTDQKHTVKNDARVTKVGSFLRKTSLDELPQFFNVLQGHMSVVGPRPHLKSLAMEYQKNVNNYLERHAMKPGITGLAQVRGYRGEIKKRLDIKNRIRLDIFYIENWSIFLDIKIILQTVFNVYKGDEKAY